MLLLLNDLMCGGERVFGRSCSILPFLIFFSPPHFSPTFLFTKLPFIAPLILRGKQCFSSSSFGNCYCFAKCFCFRKKIQSSSLFVCIVANKKQEDLFLINFAFTEPSVCPLERHRPFPTFFAHSLNIYVVCLKQVHISSVFRSIKYHFRKTRISEEKKLPASNSAGSLTLFSRRLQQLQFFPKTTPPPLISQHIKKKFAPPFPEVQKEISSEKCQNFFKMRFSTINLFKAAMLIRRRNNLSKGKTIIYKLWLKHFWRSIHFPFGFFSASSTTFKTGIAMSSTFVFLALHKNVLKNQPCIKQMLHVRHVEGLYEA